jgi:hypothetical protein
MILTFRYLKVVWKPPVGLEAYEDDNKMMTIRMYFLD